MNTAIVGFISGIMIITGFSYVMVRAFIAAKKTDTNLRLSDFFDLNRIFLSIFHLGIGMLLIFINTTTVAFISGLTISTGLSYIMSGTLIEVEKTDTDIHFSDRFDFNRIFVGIFYLGIGMLLIYFK